MSKIDWHTVRTSNMLAFSELILAARGQLMYHYLLGIVAESPRRFHQRELYDFFDNHNVRVNVVPTYTEPISFRAHIIAPIQGVTGLVQHGVYEEREDPKSPPEYKRFSTREEAETAAFTYAFHLLDTILSQNPTPEDNG